MEQAWFEMQPERGRPFALATWVPLLSLLPTVQGEHSQPGYQEQFLGAVSVAVPPAFREQAERLTFDRHSLSNHGSFAFEDGTYKSADRFQFQNGVDAGVCLVLRQRNPGDGPDLWHLNQDIVFALGLIEESDHWIRPEENFAIVVRRRRSGDGAIGAIEMRSDFLRDYLCARGMALRLLTLRTRESIEPDAGHISWPGGRLQQVLPPGRFVGTVTAIHPGGSPVGAGVAVFHVRRTDVDGGADIPVMGPPTDESTEHTSRRFQRQGQVIYRIMGEWHSEEWIEPATQSPRVRGDHVPSTASFIVNNAGERQLADALRNENTHVWLWFETAILLDILALRGGKLTWYTHDTGEIEGENGGGVHFGINDAGMVNALAYDVARLSEWLRLLWSARNTYANGLVCPELLDSQVGAEPAETIAPEARIADHLARVDAAAQAAWGVAVFRPHDIDAQLIASLHRFRATDRASVLELAKDAARLTADRIDMTALQRLVPPTTERIFSLKSLERVLALSEGAAAARTIMAPLAGIYDLRLGAAHLPSSQIEQSFALAGIELDATPYQQAVQLLTALVNTLETIAIAIERAGHAKTL